MTAGIRIGISKSHAVAWWIVLCLFAGLLVLGCLAAPTPASADMHPISLHVLSSPVDGHSDCDHGAGVTGHCHTSICSAFAQAAAAPLAVEGLASGHPAVVSQESPASRSPQPNLRPPKPFIQS